MKKILFAIATIMMAFSCTMVNEVNDVNVGKNVIKATSGEETRTAIKDNGDNTYSHVWEKGDAFVLYDVITPLKYEIVGEGGDTKADFAGEALSGETALYPVFYPYADNIDIYYADGINFFEYTFPSEVSGAVDNYAQNVMIGLSDGKNVQMMNCASYVKLAYSTNVVSYVDSIKIEALGGEPLSGKFRFGIDGATSSVISVPDEKLTAENAKVLVKFDGSEALTANARTFYVALPPVELSKGLKFTFYGTFNGRSEQVYTSSTAKLERNMVLDMPEIEKTYSFDVAEVTIGSGDPVIFEKIDDVMETANGATEPVLIKMLSDVISTDNLEINNENGNKITVDLNGFTISSKIIVTTDFEVTDSDGHGVIEAASSTIKMGEDETFGVDATFTLNGGTIKALSGNYAVSADGKKDGPQPTVIIKKGSIVGENGSAVRIKYAKATFGDGTEGNISATAAANYVIWTSTQGSVTLNKGTYTATGAAKTFHFGAATAVVDINDGFYKSETGIFNLYSAGLLTINGGYFDAPELVTGNKKTASTVTKGGYYTVKPNFASTGYAPKELAPTLTVDGVEYNYTFIEFNGMISVGGVDYESVAEAVAAINGATSDVTVKFLQNINLDQEIVINNPNAKITLDLNGKIIRAKKESGYSAVVVEGASTVVDLIDSVGEGMFDHAYGGTGYTLTIKSGTVNNLSANISNMTSIGYGRVAVRVLATGAPAYFNMTGGIVRGGRAIRVGGAGESARAYVTVSGGLVEGRNDDDSSYYSAISTETGYSNVLINGGTIKGNGAKSIIYCNSDNAGTSTIVITKNDVTGTIPFLYSNGCKYAVAAGGSSDYGKKVYTGSTWNYYTNNSSNSWIGSTLTKTALSPTIKDEYGYEYTYRCHKGD